MLHERIDIVIDGYTTENCNARLYTYVLDNYPTIDASRRRPAVLVCPGGGYSHTSDREAEAVAIQMNAMGIHAFVLYYDVAPAVRFPMPQLEAAKAMITIREHAKEWNIDEEKIMILGFSAGGHLAGSIGAFYNKEFICEPLHTAPEMIKPAGMVLCYPVITSGEFAHRGSFENLLGEKEAELSELVSLEKQVTPDTPPAFIWHTYEDGSVPVENSLLYAAALRKAGVPFELHIYPRGGHGLSLGTEETQSANGGNTVIPEVQNWISMAGRWIKELCV